MSETWRARIRLKGVNPFVLVSRARARRVRPNVRRPIPVLVTLNGRPQRPGRVNLVPKGDGTFYLYLNGPLRRGSGTKVGDSVEVRITFDRAYRGGPSDPIPEALASGIASSPVVARAWRELPPSGKKEILRYLAALKSDRSRATNIDRALRVLGGEHARFLGKSWNEPRGRRADRSRGGGRSRGSVAGGVRVETPQRGVLRGRGHGARGSSR